MPCPFPGMDPFLEMPPFRGDVSPKLLTQISNALLPKVLPKYDVRIEELDYPDIEPRAQRRLRLIYRPTGQVVTVMELLSPTNKAPGEDGLDAYLEKRAEFLASGSHLVEFDLLRGGERLPMAGPLPKGDYYVYVGRAHRRPRGQIITWPLRWPLPSVPIPLLPDDPEVTLDLQAVFRAAYEPSLYDRRLGYDQPLLPPLPPQDEAWVGERLREFQGRSPA